MENYEDKIKEAKQLLDKLSSENLTLYDSMKIYKEGLKILDEATKILDEAKLEYEEIKN